MLKLLGDVLAPPELVPGARVGLEGHDPAQIEPVPAAVPAGLAQRLAGREQVLDRRNQLLNLTGNLLVRLLVERLGGGSRSGRRGPGRPPRGLSRMRPRPPGRPVSSSRRGCRAGPRRSAACRRTRGPLLRVDCSHASNVRSASSRARLLLRLRRLVLHGLRDELPQWSASPLLDRLFALPGPWPAGLEPLTMGARGCA